MTGLSKPGCTAARTTGRSMEPNHVRLIDRTPIPIDPANSRSRDFKLG